MARPLYRHTAHQERPQTVIRGTTESARTLPLPHQNPHFMRLSGIARHRDRAITVKPEAETAPHDAIVYLLTQHFIAQSVAMFKVHQPNERIYGPAWSAYSA